MANSKTATRHDGVHIYLYYMPVTTRKNLCKILTNLQVWSELAAQMGYNTSQIEEIKNAISQESHTEAEELLIRWADYNHTVTELFVLLRRFHQYQAMNVIKDLVDQQYHKLIRKSFITYNHLQSNKETNHDILDANECASVKPKRKYDKLTGAINLKDELPTVSIEEYSDEYAGRIPKIDLNELRDATNNWNLRNVVGKGGYGTVYKAIWKHTSIAIKRIINIFDEQAKEEESKKYHMKQSLDELRHLNDFRHDNILPLYGCNINGGEVCLVYQLMLGGSLEQRLFHRTAYTPALTWKQRVNISIGTAKGLQFLHTSKVRKPLIHGDIKPANILLDLWCQPKIGDFGLAREGNFQDEGMKVSQVCGTRPYLPEDFMVHRILSIKVDSYSFGIVLFQLATGLRAEIQSIYLADYIQAHTAQGTILGLIDETPQYDTESKQIFEKVIDLGKKCTHKQSEIRLDMVRAYESLANTFMFGQQYF